MYLVNNLFLFRVNKKYHKWCLLRQYWGQNNHVNKVLYNLKERGGAIKVLESDTAK